MKNKLLKGIDTLNKLKIKGEKFKMSLGDKIREVRENLNVDRIEFAEMLGVSKTTIAKYETNKINPSKKIIERIKTISSVDITKVDYEEYVKISKSEYIKLKNEVLLKDGLINKLRKDNLKYKDQIEMINKLFNRG